MILPAPKSLRLKVLIGPLVCALLIACGQKGALFIPEPDQQPAVSPQTLPEPGAAQPLTVPEQQQLPAEEENGVPAPTASDEAAEATSE